MTGRLLQCALAAIVAGAGAGYMPALIARDFERAGEVWPIIEPDLLASIQARLEGAQKSGELDRMNQAFAARAQRGVRRPGAVRGIMPALEDKSWDYDPTIAIDQDIRDTKGNLIAAKGQRVNPLEMVVMPKALLFINGDSPSEVAWAMGQGDDGKAMIILVNGSPFDLMKARQRRIYFDQGGNLTTKFGITHTPALVRQKKTVLEVREVLLKRAER
jgi:conjugal transfer pilus assembly protein TraW